MPERQIPWSTRVRQQAAIWRQRTPLPSREALTSRAGRAMPHRGEFAGPLAAQTAPRILRERHALAERRPLTAEPLILWTSDMPGLVAAAQILRPDQADVVPLLGAEYTTSSIAPADPELTWHIHVWSFIRPALPPDLARRARSAYPIPAGCSYWLHSEGTCWAPNTGRGAEHLCAGTAGRRNCWRKPSRTGSPRRADERGRERLAQARRQRTGRPQRGSRLGWPVAPHVERPTVLWKRAITGIGSLPSEIALGHAARIIGARACGLTANRSFDLNCPPY